MRGSSATCRVSIGPRSLRVRNESAAHRGGIAVTLCGQRVGAHAKRPRFGVGVNENGSSLSRKPVDLPEQNPSHKHSRAVPEVVFLICRYSGPTDCLTPSTPARRRGGRPGGYLPTRVVVDQCRTRRHQLWSDPVPLPNSAPRWARTHAQETGEWRLAGILGSFVCCRSFNRGLSGVGGVPTCSWWSQPPVRGGFS